MRGQNGTQPLKGDCVAEDIDELITQCVQETDRCFEVVYSLPVNEGNSKEVLLCCLFHRLLTTYKGVCSLLRLRLTNEARVLARTLLEIVFRIRAINRNDEALQRYIADGKIFQKKALKGLLNLPADWPAPATKDEIAEALNSVAQAIGDPKAKETSVSWYAEKAELKGLYITAYALLCDAAHVSVREIEQYLEIKDEKIVGLLHTPDIEEALQVITLGAELLKISLHELSSIFSIDEYESICSQLQILAKENIE